MWVLLVGAIAGFLAAIISSFFTQNGKTDVSKLKINTSFDDVNDWFEDDEDEEYTHTSSYSKPKPKKHNGKCDGDCANCPPHYGYRYGRWYYGHSHTEGCTFGGNKCNGGRD